MPSSLKGLSKLPVNSLSCSPVNVNKKWEKKIEVGRRFGNWKSIGWLETRLWSRPNYHLIGKLRVMPQYMCVMDCYIVFPNILRKEFPSWWLSSNKLVFCCLFFDHDDDASTSWISTQYCYGYGFPLHLFCFPLE